MKKLLKRIIELLERLVEFLTGKEESQPDPPGTGKKESQPDPPGT